jgi:hypothetical protein
MLQREKVQQLIHHLTEIWKLLNESVIPTEAAHHFKIAKKEGLLGIQALLDHEIKKLEAEEKSKEDQVKGQKIAIKD